MDWWIWIYWLAGLFVITGLGSFFVKKYRDTYGYTALVVSWSALILFSNVIASRLVKLELFSTALIVPSAAAIFPFTAQIVDMVNEVYGRRATYIAIALTLAANVFATLIVWHASAMEPAVFTLPDTVYEEAWRFYMLQMPRIVVASYLAFWVASTVDAKVFADMKKYFYNKYRESYRSLKTIIMFVLARSVVSDVLNMIIDTLIFITVAFSFTIPQELLQQMILNQALVKITVIIATQPFLVGYRWIIRDVPRTVD